MEGSDFIVSDTNRLTEVFSSIADSEYEIRWQDRAGAFQSPNRAQNLRFSYFTDGFTAQRRVKENELDEWSIGLRLERFGRPSGPNELRNGEMTVERRSAIVAHDGIEIHYDNDLDGMRQSFMVHEAGGDGLLRLEIAVLLEGIEMGVSEQRDYVYFVDRREEVMRYSDLNVWDARGRSLDAWFEAVDSEHFFIVVDDSEAQYPLFVDPLSHYWGVTGPQNYAQYGFSVAYGNFNGVQMGDIAVGAPYYDDGQTDEWKVFVYYGQDTLPTTPSWTGQCDYTAALFGYSLSSGDVDGNGVDDLIVGASLYDRGAVYVWLGSAGSGLGADGTDSNRDWFKMASSGYRYGFSVGAGDFNGDGKDDLIVGAPVEPGKVYVYHGTSTGPASTESWTATCGTSGALFGASVANAGDVNDNTYEDIIIGAPGFTNGQNSEGAAFIWHGGPGGLSPSPGTGTNMARRLEGNQASAQFGYAVAGGDINGDAYSDVVVGAPLFDSGQTDEGMAIVWYGSSDGIPATAGWLAQSDQAGAQFGFSVAIFDVVHATNSGETTDGYADVVIGAPYFNYTESDNGGVFVWYGSSSGLGSNGTPSNADWRAHNVRANAYSGWSLAVGEYVGYYFYPGIIVGSPGDTGGSGSPKGAANAFVNSPD